MFRPQDAVALMQECEMENYNSAED